MFKEFKSLVDQAKLNSVPINLEDAYQKYGYVFSNKISFTAHLYQLIREQVEMPLNEKPLQKSKLFKIKEDLISRYIIAQEPFTPYFEIIQVLNDSCKTERTGFIEFEKEQNWLKAIEFALVLNQLSDNYFLDDNRIQISYKEHFDRAHSLKALKDYGYPIELSDEDIKINADQIFTDIEKEVKRMGGYQIAHAIFNELKKLNLYSPLFDRFKIIRESNLQGLGQPQIPFGYLLNLCAKYPHSDTYVTEKEIQRLFHNATIACNATYAVQHYSIWDHIIRAGESTFELMSDLAIWDTVFSIPQAKATYQLELIKYIIDSFKKVNFEDLFNFNASEFLKVASVVFAPNGNGPNRFTAQSIAKQANLSFSKVQSILLEMSHPGKTNAKYLVPADSEKTDYLFKPFIKHKDKYILLWRSWNALALFELIATKYRRVVKNFDGDIGFILESFLQQKLTQKGITFSCGKYKVGQIDGEADLVIETAEKIVLIEIKKKVLTRKAKSGNDVSLIVDLSETVIDASIQSTRTELLLREQEQITLVKEDGTEYILKRNQRNFEHISLSHLEFGGMHDKGIMQGLKTSLLEYNWFVIDQKDKRNLKKFEELRQKQKEFRRQYQELMNHKAMLEHNPYFDNWFLNYNQLLEIIALSEDNDQFYKHLIQTKFMNYGTLDFFTEFEISLRLSEDNHYEKLRRLSEQKNARILTILKNDKDPS